jgi:hypothetical protein
MKDKKKKKDQNCYLFTEVYVFDINFFLFCARLALFKLPFTISYIHGSNDMIYSVSREGCRKFCNGTALLKGW